MSKVLQKHNARANVKGDCVIEIAGVNNTDFFRLRAVVGNVDLDIGYIQLYYIVEVVFVDLAVDSI